MVGFGFLILDLNLDKVFGFGMALGFRVLVLEWVCV